LFSILFPDYTRRKTKKSLQLSVFVFKKYKKKMQEMKNEENPDQGQTNEELILRNLFFKMNGISLFEESHLKLNLLLRDSFYGLSFHSWYQWRPLQISKSMEEENVWNLILDLKRIPILVQNWIQEKQPKILDVNKYHLITLEISLYNFIDLPEIRSFAFLKHFKPILSLIGIQFKPSKKYNEFCSSDQSKDQLDKFYGKSEHSWIKEIKKNQHTLWFFKQGFFIAPSSIEKARYGLFSLKHITPGQYLFDFEGEKLTTSEFSQLSQERRLELESYVFEASFLISRNDKKNQVTYVINPFIDAKTPKIQIEDMRLHPNLGPWINEPSLGNVSNVFMQAFTFFDLRLENVKRYALQIISARNIKPLEELFLHYEGSYCRKNYIPGEKCPDLLD
jgi:hypothetical protein